MPELIYFKGIDGSTISIPDRIGESMYKQFGELILEHPGDRFPQNIPTARGDDGPSSVVHGILVKWVNGKGIKDRTWRGLMDVLRRIQFDALAEYIADAKDM